ncbi:MAG: ChaN family lipoprotein [Thermodesulfobacteriota bacterium]
MIATPLYRGAASALLVFVLLFAGGCVAKKAMRLRDRAIISVADMETELKDVRLVFVGEYHKRIRHHMMQLDIIKALERAGIKLAIGLEMFTAENQDVLDRWVEGEVSEIAFRKQYYRNWKVPWYKYRGIFIYARNRKIPLVGLNISKKVSHKLFIGGPKVLSPEERAALGDISCDVDMEYEKMIREAMEEHEHMGADFQDFCRVQMSWDSFMGSRVVDYLVAHPARVMVVLAGSGHAWKRGIARKVVAATRLDSIVILPEVVGEYDRRDVSVGDADFLLLAR